MLIKDIVLKTAVLLQLTDIEKYLQDQSGYTDLQNQDLKLLTDCVNMVIDEISTEYIPLKTEQSLKSKNKQIQLSELDFEVNDIFYVKKDGKKQRFEMFFDRLLLDDDAQYLVCYSRKSPKADLNDSCCYKDSVVGSRIIALGAARDYCIITGRLDEAQLFEQRFKQSIANKLSEKQHRRLPARDWF